jgi:sugar/nucleoside kinase (ribokinase family)
MSLAIYGELGVDILLDKNASFTTRFGGAGLYAAIVAARLGMKTDFLTVYGPEVDKYRLDFWEEIGVVTKNARYEENYILPKYLVTGYKAYERKISTPMADIRIGVKYSPEIDSDCEGLLLFPIDHSFPESLCIQAREREIPIFLDPKPNIKSIEMAREIMKYTTVLLVNEEEAMLLSNTTCVRDSIDKLKGMGPRYIIIKRAHKGCILIDGDDIKEFHAYKSNVKCTLGSGDAFGGALAATFIETQDIEYSVQIGNCVAANFIENEEIETVIDKDGVEKDLSRREKLHVSESSIRVYLAGPFFNDQEVQWVQRVENKLDGAGLQVLSPMKENGIITGDMTIEHRLKIFESDIALLNKSDVVVALLDHDDPGTCFEIGHAYSLGIPVYGLKTLMDNLNNMIRFGCKGIFDDVEELIKVIYER